MPGKIKLPDNGCRVEAAASDFPLTGKELLKIRDFETMVRKRLAIVGVYCVWSQQHTIAFVSTNQHLRRVSRALMP
jgi:hypothetical protein